MEGQPSELSGKDLRRLRLVMGVSARDLAAHLGIGRARWSACENGHGGVSENMAERLRSALPVEAILTGGWETPGRRLYRIRRALGHSQEEFGALLGLAAGEVSHIESGDYRLTLRMAERVSRACGTEPDWLLFWCPVGGERGMTPADDAPPVTPGEKLRRLRESLGHSQTSFAKLLGVCQPQISRLEGGRQRICPKMAARISARTTMNVEYLRKEAP